MPETLKMGDFTAQLDSAEAEELRTRFAENGPGFADLRLPARDRLKTLGAALAAVQADIPEVVKAATANIPGKDGKQGYRYSYADLADVTRAILPLLGQNGLAWITRPTLVDGRFVLLYTLMHGASGETLEGMYPLPDRGSPQDMGGAITYARRYALCSVTGVAPDDDDDAAQATAAHRREATLPPPMSSYEHKLGLAMTRNPLPDERKAASEDMLLAAFRQSVDFAACIESHKAWRTNAPDDEQEYDAAPTWGDRLAARVYEEIQFCTDATGLQARWAAIKDAKLNALTWEAVTAAQAVTVALKRIRSQREDQLAGQISAAADGAELARYGADANEALTTGDLAQEQHANLTALLQERGRKLEQGNG
jgi:hypothetical protein